MQVACFYHQKYEMTPEKAHEVLRSVAHILASKGLSHLIVNPHLIDADPEL